MLIDPDGAIHDRLFRYFRVQRSNWTTQDDAFKLIPGEGQFPRVVECVRACKPEPLVLNEPKEFGEAHVSPERPGEMSWDPGFVVNDFVVGHREVQKLKGLPISHFPVCIIGRDLCVPKTLSELMT